MMPTVVKEQAPVPPPSYQRAQAKQGPAETDPRHGLHIPLVMVATKSVAGSGWDLAGKRGSPSKRVIVLFIERIPALSLPRHGKRGEERRRLTRIRFHSCLLSTRFPFSA